MQPHHDDADAPETSNTTYVPKVTTGSGRGGAGVHVGVSDGMPAREEGAAADAGGGDGDGDDFIPTVGVCVLAPIPRPFTLTPDLHPLTPHPHGIYRFLITLADTR